MIRRPPRSTLSSSSAASDVYKRQVLHFQRFFFQAEDGIRDRSPSRGLGDVYKRQPIIRSQEMMDVGATYQVARVQRLKIRATRLVAPTNLGRPRIVSAMFTTSYPRLRRSEPRLFAGSDAYKRRRGAAYSSGVSISSIQRRNLACIVSQTSCRSAARLR